MEDDLVSSSSADSSPSRVPRPGLAAGPASGRGDHRSESDAMTPPASSSSGDLALGSTRVVNESADDRVSERRRMASRTSLLPAAPEGTLALPPSSSTSFPWSSAPAPEIPQQQRHFSSPPPVRHPPALSTPSPSHRKLQSSQYSPMPPSARSSHFADLTQLRSPSASPRRAPPVCPRWSEIRPVGSVLPGPRSGHHLVLVPSVVVHPGAGRDVVERSPKIRPLPTEDGPAHAALLELSGLLADVTPGGSPMSPDSIREDTTAPLLCDVLRLGGVGLLDSYDPSGLSFDLGACKWNDVRKPTPSELDRGSFACASFDGKVYMFGCPAVKKKDEQAPRFAELFVLDSATMLHQRLVAKNAGALSSRGEPLEPRVLNGASLTYVPQTRYTYKHPRLFVLGGVTEADSFGALHVFDLITNEWIEPEYQNNEMCPLRWGHSSIYHSGDENGVGRKIVVFGGYAASPDGRTEGAAPCNDVYFLNFLPNGGLFWIHKDSAATLSPPPRALHVATVWQTKMIVFGGLVAGSSRGPHSGAAASNDLWIFDLECAKWEPVTIRKGQGPSPRSESAAFVLFNQLFLHGGRCSNPSKRTLSDTWMLDLGPPLPPQRLKVMEALRNVIRVAWIDPFRSQPNRRILIQLREDGSDVWHDAVRGAFDPSTLSTDIEGYGESGNRVRPGRTYHLRLFAFNEFGSTPARDLSGLLVSTGDAEKESVLNEEGDSNIKKIRWSKLSRLIGKVVDLASEDETVAVTTLPSDPIYKPHAFFIRTEDSPEPTIVMNWENHMVAEDDGLDEYRVECLASIQLAIDTRATPPRMSVPSQWFTVWSGTETHLKIRYDDIVSSPPFLRAYSEMCSKQPTSQGREILGKRKRRSSRQDVGLDAHMMPTAAWPAFSIDVALAFRVKAVDAGGCIYFGDSFPAGSKRYPTSKSRARPAKIKIAEIVPSYDVAQLLKDLETSDAPAPPTAAVTNKRKKRRTAQSAPVSVVPIPATPLSPGKQLPVPSSDLLPSGEDRADQAVVIDNHAVPVDANKIEDTRVAVEIGANVETKAAASPEAEIQLDVAHAPNPAAVAAAVESELAVDGSETVCNEPSLQKTIVAPPSVVHESDAQILEEPTSASPLDRDGAPGDLVTEKSLTSRSPAEVIELGTGTTNGEELEPTLSVPADIAEQNPNDGDAIFDPMLVDSIVGAAAASIDATALAMPFAEFGATDTAILSAGDERTGHAAGGSSELLTQLLGGDSSLLEEQDDPDLMKVDAIHNTTNDDDVVSAGLALGSISGLTVVPHESMDLAASLAGETDVNLLMASKLSGGENNPHLRNIADDFNGVDDEMNSVAALLNAAVASSNDSQIAANQDYQLLAPSPVRSASLSANGDSMPVAVAQLVKSQDSIGCSISEMETAETAFTSEDDGFGAAVALSNMQYAISRLSGATSDEREIPNSSYNEPPAVQLNTSAFAAQETIAVSPVSLPTASNEQPPSGSIEDNFHFAGASAFSGKAPVNSMATEASEDDAHLAETSSEMAFAQSSAVNVDNVDGNRGEPLGMDNIDSAGKAGKMVFEDAEESFKLGMVVPHTSDLDRTARPATPFAGDGHEGEDQSLTLSSESTGVSATVDIDGRLNAAVEDGANGTDPQPLAADNQNEVDRTVEPATVPATEGISVSSGRADDSSAAEASVPSRSVEVELTSGVGAVDSAVDGGATAPPADEELSDAEDDLVISDLMLDANWEPLVGPARKDDLWYRGLPYGTRVKLLSLKDRAWYAARLVAYVRFPDVPGTFMLLHYEGFGKKWDEFLPLAYTAEVRGRLRPQGPNPDEPNAFDDEGGIPEDGGSRSAGTPQRTLGSSLDYLESPAQPRMTLRTSMGKKGSSSNSSTPRRQSTASSQMDAFAASVVWGNPAHPLHPHYIDPEQPFLAPSADRINHVLYEVWDPTRSDAYKTAWMRKKDLLSCARGVTLETDKAAPKSVTIEMEERRKRRRERAARRSD
ncbi:hypothetical protein DFJ73DRAFT_472211 [Zopfochytrium polystomum]|nr:hypothetical protein DFJ73DRAFT_472211 [Zopfochytrium polystomum]